MWKGSEVVDAFEMAGLDARREAVLDGIPTACPAGEDVIETLLEREQFARKRDLAAIPTTGAGGGVCPVKHGRRRRRCGRWYRYHGTPPV